nr:hypothetical protein [Tanacetum cinerariifolium]
MLEKLGLDVEDHPAPYQLTWLKKRNVIKVSKRCFLHFSIGKIYQEGYLKAAPIDDKLGFTTIKMDVKIAFLNGELDEEVYMNQSQGFIMSGNENKVLRKFNYFDSTSVSTPMDTSEKLIPNNGRVVSKLEYSRVIGCFMYAITYTRPDIAFVLGKLSSNTKDNSSTNGRVFLLGGAAGREAEGLRNLILKILLRSKLIAPISIICDSASTLAKDYSQMYNGKLRRVGVRHSMICELIMNKVVSIEFVRSQQNLADHLRKGVARDLVLKSVEGLVLKSNLVTEC